MPIIRPLFIITLFLSSTLLVAQSVDSTASKKKDRKIVALPAISYTPETQFTIGVVGFYFMDFSKNEAGTRKSFIKPTLIYSTAKQVIIEAEWEVFSYKEEWIVRGIGGYRDFPFRNYGQTNDASESVTEVDLESGELHTLNYLRYTSRRLYFRPIVLKKIREHMYVGLQYDFTSLFKYRRLADSVSIQEVSAPSILEIEDQSMTGRRSGIGVNLAFDNRDHAVSPYSGLYIQGATYHFGKAIGSEFNFGTYNLDARAYFTAIKDQQHVIALRGQGVFSTGTRDQRVPVSALGEIGGRKQLMGYFRNTYLGNQMLLFQAEYRMPVWKIFGLTAVLGAANAFADLEDPAFGQFRAAAGAGLRVRINKANRTFLRVDYALGFHKPEGVSKRQTGLYVSMGEAF
ncbi:MAG: BamA/TamA family outer membrane protein [Bacteroidota bacterium]